MRNLIENAVNYAPEGGLVVVEAEREPHALVLRVLDNGPGIPPADLTRVFERFYRVDKSRSRAPGGTGIGLAIVKHLVELLGGTVTAGSRAKAGRCLRCAATAFVATEPLRVSHRGTEAQRFFGCHRDTEAQRHSTSPAAKRPSSGEQAARE